MGIEEQVISQTQNGKSESELYRLRGLHDMGSFMGDRREPPVKTHTLRILLESGQTGEGRKWTIAGWIDDVLSGRLAFPERFYSNGVRRITIEAARRFPPVTGPNEEINNYLLERLNYYAALEVTSKNLPIKAAGQIKAAVLVNPLYLMPERISQITGLTSSEIELIVRNEGIKPLENGTYKSRALNAVDIIRYLLKSQSEKAVKLYNNYISTIKTNHKN